MQLITVSGPPSSGKTSVMANVIRVLQREGLRVGVVKFDCLTTDDDKLYQQLGVPVKVGLSGNLCPDHYFVSNIDDCLRWGIAQELDLLISESAGLCNRCSPHIKEVMAVCVIDNLMGINTPKKIGPMLKLADLVVITKGDIVSQAEREVFAFKVVGDGAEWKELRSLTGCFVPNVQHFRFGMHGRVGIGGGRQRGKSAGSGSRGGAE